MVWTHRTSYQIPKRYKIKAETDWEILAENCSLPIDGVPFLLTMIKLSSTMISNQKINIALVTQTTYIKKLKKFLKNELYETEIISSDYELNLNKSKVEKTKYLPLSS